MRKLILSALILASAFQTALGQTIVDGQWTYIVQNGGATITASTATGAVTIPSELGGYAVKNVGNGYPPVFGLPNTSMTSVTIPNSVTSIGDYAFGACTSLTSITIPSSVTSIGSSAFTGCTSLTSITIPNSVTSIGEAAFYGCTGLTAIIIPSSVTSIAESSFAECTGLISITIPNSVTSIGSGAFAGCTGLTSILLPSTQTTFPASTIPSSTTILYSSQLSSLAMDSTFGTALASNSAFYTTLAGNTAFVVALAQNPAFVQTLANSIKATSDNYGFATQSGVSSAIEPLATKSQITTAINEGKASGIASVTASPNTWSLFTTSQIQNMAVGDLVLTRQVSGGFVLNYDIEQSTDLQTWTTYQALSLPLTGLPTDKAFVRIKPKQ